MNRVKIGPWALLLFHLCAASVAWGDELNVIRSIELVRGGSLARLVITGDRAPAFSIFRLDNPSCLVVHLPGADVSEVEVPREGQGLVQSVTKVQFGGEGSSFARIALVLSQDARYGVKIEGNRLVVTVGTGPLEVPEISPPVDGPEVERPRASETWVSFDAGSGLVTYSGEGFEPRFSEADPEGRLEDHAAGAVDLTYFHIMSWMRKAVLGCLEINYVNA